MMQQKFKRSKKMNAIAQKISECRKNKGLTQEELADKAHINLRTIQRIENCESEPRGKTLNLIAQVLEIDINEILSNETNANDTSISAKFTNLLFLFIFNLLQAFILGFLCFDIGSNLKSRIAAHLISIIFPLLIVQFTKNFSPIKRLIEFGFGYMIYFLAVWVMHGFPAGINTGLFSCLLLSISILYFGDKLVRITPKQG